MGRFPVFSPVPWGPAEDRKVHPRAEKRSEIEPEFKEQGSPQTILQIGKLETQRREALDQVTPSQEPKAETEFSPRGWDCTPA